MKTQPKVKRPKYAKVLAWVNAERKAMGRPVIKALPVGNQYHHAYRCPIATALGLDGVRVSIESYCRPGEDKFRTFPDHVQKFSEGIESGRITAFTGERYEPWCR